MATYYAFNMVVNQWAKFSDIASVTYSDEDVYEGRTHSFEFPMQAVNTASGNAYVTKASAANEVSPDSVEKIDPTPTMIKRSIITLTAATGGAVFKLYRDQLMNGCVQNTDPFA